MSLTAKIFWLFFIFTLIGISCLTYKNIQKNQALPLHIQQKQKAKTEGLNFKVYRLNGQEISVSDFLGSVVLVNFWATWCAPCIEEIPSLNRLAGKLSKSLVILAVSNERMDDVKNFLVAFPNLKENFVPAVMPAEKMEKLLNIKMFPETYILDKKGLLIKKVIGPQEWDSAKWLKQLTSYL